MQEEKIGIVLLNLGGPDSLEAVEPFLYNLFCDPDIINFPGSFLFRKGIAKLISSTRHPKVQKQYAQIGNKSPIKEFTLGQAKMLEEKLNKHFPAKVYAAMRYWHPFTEETLDELEREGITKVILLPLYPQYSMATTESSVKEWKKHLEKRNSKIKWTLIEHYYDFPPYIDACVERINEGLEKFSPDVRDEVDILFSAHGTPMKLVRQGDPYSGHICETVTAVRERGGWKNPHRLCFQSKVGPQKWLTPSTPDTIDELAENGSKMMLVVPIAFASDHLETLFEVGIEFKHLAKEAGIEQFEVTQGLNYSEKFIDALAQLVLEKTEDFQSKSVAANN
ncbi:MAG: ferrochelatase [Acidobacteriota bacterium]|jgi:ferrochelatase|nr:ferrochelatase [Acidobacteriota bacterium]